MKLSIIIPVFNEVNTIATIVQKVQGVKYNKEIIIVDDASTDGTKEVLQKISQQPDITVLYHKTNCGTGTAIQTAVKSIAGDIAIIQDADLEYDPRDYSRLLAPIERDGADVVYGSRFAGGESHRALYLWHSVGNRVLTLLSNMMSNLNMTDMEVCYKVFRREIIQDINLVEDRFGFEPEVTARLARYRKADGSRLRIFEVGISYAGRTYEEGKKIGYKDGLRALWCIVRYNLKPD